MSFAAPSSVPARQVLRAAAAFAAAALLAACSTGAGRAAPARPALIRRLVVALAPWALPAPVSRAVVLPTTGGLVVAGGLTGSGVSAGGVFRFDPATGANSQIGTLAHAVHDAAGLVLGGSGLVLGGGAATSISAVQGVALTGAGPGSLDPVVGQLPQPRSDLVATTLGGVGYVLGGYDGQHALPGVLATTDGTHIHQVATLPVPVRYPALTTDGNRLLVIGGEAAGVPSDAVQLVDPATNSARVVARLPYPLAHAAAFTLDGEIVVAGGVSSSGVVQGAVLRVDPVSFAVSTVGRLPRPVSDAGSAVLSGVGYLIGGESAPSTPVTAVQTLRVLVSAAPPARPSAGGASASRSPSAAAAPTVSDARPFLGSLLIADRGNDRLLLVTVGKRIIWRYPSSAAPPPPGGFYFPDDAFFTGRGTGIISNQEGNNTIVQIAYPSGQVTWVYGHPGVAGSAPGYLNQPDDAFLLPGGDVVVADAKNCRILWISPAGHPLRQVGDGSCVHAPPRSLGYPNGDTPLAGGDTLVSEIDGSWITDLTPAGGLRWTVHLPIAYPSDPQQIGPDRYLVADYTLPGSILEFDRAGTILWRYRYLSGHAMLNHPSLAELLPGGFIAVNDDYRDRVLIIDVRTKRIVWEYGVDDTPGTRAGLLNTPDGFDLLAPDGQTTPTHPQTG
ncbi:MAG TPA: hypothetical protein VNE21_05315 [Mycobacteriales bacterium]|nr:hypothetical protein [Mycobacteriales bacterium]